MGDSWRYACKYRPPTFATVPAGWVLLETGLLAYDMRAARPDLPIGRSKFGVIGYDRKLTPEEVERHDLHRVYPQCTSVDRGFECKLDAGHSGSHMSSFGCSWTDAVGRYEAAKPVHNPHNTADEIERLRAQVAKLTAERDALLAAKGELVDVLSLFMESGLQPSLFRRASDALAKHGGGA